MGKPDLGLKMTCTSCAARFFDLNRAPGVCPKCGTVQPPPRPRPTAAARSASRKWLPRQAAIIPAEAVGEAAADAIDVSEGLDDVDPPEVDDDDEDVEVPEATEES